MKKNDSRKVFNNVINEIETTNGRVLSMYDVRNLTSQGNNGNNSNACS